MQEIIKKDLISREKSKEKTVLETHDIETIREIAQYADEIFSYGETIGTDILKNQVHVHLDSLENITVSGFATRTESLDGIHVHFKEIVN